jgi:multiple sugar transport system permease protein
MVAVLFLLPAALVFLMFTAYPMVGSLVLSLFRWDGMSNRQFVGLDNYHMLAEDPLLRTVLTNTFIFMVSDVALNMALALFLAIVIDRYVGRLVRGLFRAVVFFPVIVSGAAIGIIWQWLMSTDLGLINYYLGALGLPIVSWLDSSSNALRSLILVDVWRNVGFSFVVLTAGLQGISSHYYEAAAIDGANERQQIRWITLPLLSPTIFFLLVINLIGAFQFFDLSYVMTRGGPGDATRTIMYYIYATAFSFFRFGYGSAIAVLLFAILAVLTFTQVRLSRRWVFYE